MNYFKSFAALAICTSLLFSATSAVNAQDPNEWVYTNWSSTKDKALKMAKEQDRFLFLFIGLRGCGICELASRTFASPENNLAATVVDNYIPWAYKATSSNISNIADPYIKDLFFDAYYKGLQRFPALILVNPEYPDSIYRWICGESIMTTVPLNLRVERMMKLITVDLMEGSGLPWYDNEAQVLKLAKEQGKFIFKMVGRGTSPNCQKMIPLLKKGPIKQLLNETFIFWYSTDIAEDDAEEMKTLPHISIFHYDAPEILIESLRGTQEEETMEELLSKYTVSNERLTSGNRVSVLGNVLYISNQSNDEQISVYSSNGQKITSVRKNDYTVRIDISHFPKGIWIVHSSNGWSAKVAN